MNPVLVIAGLLVVASPPRLGEVFSLKMSASASLEDVDLTLTFSDVTRDSRCPKDVLCVVAGEAVVELEASTGSETTKLTFEIPPGGSDEKELGDLTIAVTALEPEPVSGKRMERSSYIAEVLVSSR